jgi:hypothetical protein
LTDLFTAAPDLSGNAEREEILAKWKDKPAEDILKAKVDSDLYIKTLEKQKDELRADYLKQREELLAKAKFEELIDRFEKAPKDLQVATPAANEESPKYDPKDVEALVLNKIQETKVLEKQTANFNQVQLKLKERYGNSYLDVLRDQQNSLGLSNSDVNDLAMKSPEAFFRIMGLNQEQQQNFQTPPRSSQRNDNFAPQGQKKRTWSYYQELKKSDYKAYSDPKTQVQMHKDAAELGTAFEDGDFNAY